MMENKTSHAKQAKVGIRIKLVKRNNVIKKHKVHYY